MEKCSLASVASGWFSIKVVFGCGNVSEERDELISATKNGGRKERYRTAQKEDSYATQNLFWAPFVFEFVFGPLRLCIFGVFRLWVQQSGQGKCVSRCMWILEGG